MHSHGWEPAVHLLRDLVAVLGRTGTEILICVLGLTAVGIAAFAFLFGYVFLRFGSATVSEVFRIALEAFKAFRLQFRQAHPAIRIELFFDAMLGVFMLISSAGIFGHAVLPWVRESSEELMFAVFISSLILFGFLARESIRIAVRLPQK
jgi:hypothetical protein